MGAARDGQMCGQVYRAMGWECRAMNADFRQRRRAGQTCFEIVEAIIAIPYLTYRDVPFELRVPL